MALLTPPDHLQSDEEKQAWLEQQHKESFKTTDDVHKHLQSSGAIPGTNEYTDRFQQLCNDLKIFI